MPTSPEGNNQNNSVAILLRSTHPLVDGRDSVDERPWGQQIAALKEKHPGIEAWFDRLFFGRTGGDNESTDFSHIPSEILTDLAKLFELRHKILSARESAIFSALGFADGKQYASLNRELAKLGYIKMDLIGSIGVLSLENQRRKEGRVELVTDELRGEIARILATLSFSKRKPGASAEKPQTKKKKQPCWNPVWDTNERAGISIDAIDV